MLMPRPRLRAASENTQSTGSDRSVYTLVDGAPQQVPVVIGSTDGQYTEVVQGDLEIGETVIVDTAAANGG
jgi:HlyD family secretion protein